VQVAERSGGSLGRGIGRGIGQLQAAARNAVEVIRFGGLDTGEAPTRSTVEHEHPIYRLRRYQTEAGDPVDGPPVVLVPPMMLAADVFDVSPAVSAVRVLLEHGLDPWVVDFGAPEDEEGGLDRTLTDHLLAVSDAVDRVRDRTGRDIHLTGYSQGGMWCYQVAAYRKSEGIATVIGCGSPVDTQAMIPFGLPEDVVAGVLTFLADNVLGRQALPSWASRIGFRLLDPGKSLRQRIDFLRQLHDRDALLPREGQRRFLQQDGWVAWPGPALAELAKQTVAHNRMVSGGFVIHDRPVTLADLTCPVLSFVGERDEVAPPASVRAIGRAAPQADVYEVTMDVGHFGLVVGSAAVEVAWPTIASWVRWHEGLGAAPDAMVRVDPDAAEEDPSAASVLTQTAELAVNLGVVTAQAMATGVGRSARVMRSVVSEAREQLPRITRLERTRPSSRISLGLLLSEQVGRAPDDTLFLFEGRGHTYADANRRIDNVVAGLISIGVRHGEHVGVLMATRPSALTVVAALNRLGAVAVLLRPDGPLEREVELGQVTRVVADPERAELVDAIDGVQVLVLGGGGRPRTLFGDVIDMERIDPDAVVLPGWYRPNPGRARDLAFVLFTGSGERTRPNRITNARWALSAFGTASAASLSSSDTVYGVTPIHHPSGLLTSIGGAVAGGARLAMATSFDPDTFWDEVRRYGVTVVAYTWSQVQPLVNAPVHVLERHHPVRLFLGSGMPSGLWRRVEERFAPARVLELYASTEGEAVLVNLGSAIGSKGRPLPGSAEVRVARYDLEEGRLVTGPDGFVLPCGRGEPGMLLARSKGDGSMTMAAPLRGVFAPGDAWVVTGDLFRRDGDGDFWHLTDVASPVGLIRTPGGVLPTIPIEDALQTVGAVDLAVAYGVEQGSTELVVGAVTLRPGLELTADDLTAGMHRLDPVSWPDVVRVVERIPTSTWFRLLKLPLRAEGIPDGTSALPVFHLDRETSTYS
jgi:putative long chain acyl-CoA synthase